MQCPVISSKVYTWGFSPILFNKVGICMCVPLLYPITSRYVTSSMELGSEDVFPHTVSSF